MSEKLKIYICSLKEIIYLNIYMLNNRENEQTKRLILSKKEYIDEERY